MDVNIFLICLVVLGFSSKSMSRSSNSPVESIGDDHLNVINPSKTYCTSGHGPQIISYKVCSNITNRYVTTLIESQVYSCNSSEISFLALYPETAYIKSFTIQVGSMVYKSYLERRQEVNQQDTSNTTVTDSDTRGSNKFSTTILATPHTFVKFFFRYDQLLTRQNNRYELVLDLVPEQFVDELLVEVELFDNSDISFFKASSIRTNSKTKTNKEITPSYVDSRFGDSQILAFPYDANEQRTICNTLDCQHGFSAQLVVEFDIYWNDQGGDVLWQEGSFVHFFSPTNLRPLLHHVVFVLDSSESMRGSKEIQLKEAMWKILSELNERDIFHIVRFSDTVAVWDVYNQNSFQSINVDNVQPGNMELYLETLNLPSPTEATYENVDKIHESIKSHFKIGGYTNILAGLETGLFLTKKFKSKLYVPLLIFLSDGEANRGISNTTQIVDIVTSLNANEKVPIYSLSFGATALMDFLNKLSIKNFGLPRFIFEASDASSQLEQFYKTVSSPLLTNVNFKYTVDDKRFVEKSKISDSILFDGSSIISTGVSRKGFQPRVSGQSKTGNVTFLPKVKSSGVKSQNLEKIVAFNLLRSRIQEISIGGGTRRPFREVALDLSLKHLLLSQVTSMIVVTPNRKDLLNIESLSPPPPKWLKDAISNWGAEKFNILGKSGDVTVFPKCFNNPLNVTGLCKLLVNCPQLNDKMPTMDHYLEYFCPLISDKIKYAGLCCPS